MHGGKALAELKNPDVEALKRGLENLGKQMENAALFGVPVVVAVNRFGSDSEEELETVREYAREKGVPAEVVDVWGQGGGGAVALAERVARAQRPPEQPRSTVGDAWREDPMRRGRPTEPETWPSPPRRSDLKRIKGYGFDSCLSAYKTQKSLSAPPPGAPQRVYPYGSRGQPLLRGRFRRSRHGRCF